VRTRFLVECMYEYMADVGKGWSHVHQYVVSCFLCVLPWNGTGSR